MIEQTFALEELGVSAHVLWVSGEVHLHLWVCASVQHGLLHCRPKGVPFRDGVCFSGRLALGLVRGFLDFAYCLILKFSRAPGGGEEMAMARASSLTSPWPGCTLRTVPSVHELFYF